MSRGLLNLLNQAGIPHVEPSQPIECDSKPLDVHSPSNDDHLRADPDD